MRAFLILPIAVLTLAVHATAHAQMLPPTPSYDPAYKKFLNSPYSYRTFSAATPGYAVQQATPFGFERSYRQPGYVQQRITPSTFESSGYVPGYGGSRATPWSYERYDAPGYSYSQIIPNNIRYWR